jgi:Barstar (barnase inhibitor)
MMAISQRKCDTNEMIESQIINILKGEMSPDVYRLVNPISFVELESLNRDCGAKLFYLDGNEIVDRASLLQQFATVMQFPEYFGHNWDALADCLTDLDEDEVDRHIIIIDRLDNFAIANPQQWLTFLDICKSTVKYWQDTDTPMYMLLRGDSPQLIQANLISI